MQLLLRRRFRFAASRDKGALLYLGTGPAHSPQIGILRLEGLVTVKKDARIVAVLNDRQVLVEVLDESRFRSGKHFTVFSVRKLPSAADATVEIDEVELPKGTLQFEAFQSNRKFAVLSAWRETTRRVERRSALSEIISGQLAGIATRDVVVTEPGSISATLDTTQSMNISAGPVTVGDFCSVD